MSTKDKAKLPSINRHVPRERQTQSLHYGGSTNVRKCGKPSENLSKMSARKMNSRLELRLRRQELEQMRGLQSMEVQLQHHIEQFQKKERARREDEILSVERRRQKEQHEAAVAATREFAKQMRVEKAARQDRIQAARRQQSCVSKSTMALPPIGNICVQQDQPRKANGDTRRDIEDDQERTYRQQCAELKRKTKHFQRLLQQSREDT
eukprot:m.1642347 g.1642347  ORF g.1642347 m.1642347 type:complete len:208 (-) comp52641_c0_seq1:87-710(-)